MFDLLHNYTLDVFGEIGFMASVDGVFQPLAEAMDEEQFLFCKLFKQPMWNWKLGHSIHLGDKRKIKDNLRWSTGPWWTSNVIATAWRNQDQLQWIVLDSMEASGSP
ncbi:putative cytochrome P450 [Phytophthora cinnamomi]|uniref:putative cytochrome P450 n=1 Tax=Phytophthora cinnamomi TaxID=4785 RepID=UPI0035599FA8|nr:putative cytochrome P450 [Phytophthora cinnamomi]